MLLVWKNRHVAQAAPNYRPMLASSKLVGRHPVAASNLHSCSSGLARIVATYFVFAGRAPCEVKRHAVWRPYADNCARRRVFLQVQRNPPSAFPVRVDVHFLRGVNPALSLHDGVEPTIVAKCPPSVRFRKAVRHLDGNVVEEPLGFMRRPAVQKSRSIKDWRVTMAFPCQPRGFDVVLQEKRRCNGHGDAAKHDRNAS